MFLLGQEILAQRSLMKCRQGIGDLLRLAGRPRRHTLGTNIFEQEHVPIAVAVVESIVENGSPRHDQISKYTRSSRTRAPRATSLDVWFVPLKKALLSVNQYRTVNRAFWQCALTPQWLWLRWKGAHLLAMPAIISTHPSLDVVYCR